MSGAGSIRSFERADTEAVIQLWKECGLTRPWNDPRKDIERKLTTQPELFLVAQDDAAAVTANPVIASPAVTANAVIASPVIASPVIATAMIGWDGHRGWVSYLAVASSHRGEGLARALMAEAELRLIAVGCPKLMLMVRDDNTAVIDLYHHLGYDLEATKVMGKRLIPDM